MQTFYLSYVFRYKAVINIGYSILLCLSLMKEHYFYLYGLLQFHLLNCLQRQQQEKKMGDIL